MLAVVEDHELTVSELCTVLQLHSRPSAAAESAGGRWMAGRARDGTSGITRSS